MKIPKDFSSEVSKILKKDPRYPFDAYPFVLAALDFTLEQRCGDGGRRQPSGHLWLAGISIPLFPLA